MKKIILMLCISLTVIGLLFYLEQRGIITWRINLPFQSQSKSSSNAGGQLKVIFMDIGQGDATLIIFPNGQKMLIDCARDAVILSALGRNLPWFDRDIDYLVATHPDADHYGGCIDVLQRYNIKHIYFNGFEKEESRLLAEFHRAVAEEEKIGANFEIVSSTKRLVVASTTIQFLYPDHSILRDPHVPGVKTIESNNTSIVMKISHGAEDILLTGDMEQPLEDYLIHQFGTSLQSEVLKIGHHGSKSSSSEEFLRVVLPDYAAISVGENNSYGHPSLRVLARLERTGAQVLRTDQIGDILFSITTTSIRIGN